MVVSGLRKVFLVHESFEMSCVRTVEKDAFLEYGTSIVLYYLINNEREKKKMLIAILG